MLAAVPADDAAVVVVIVAARLLVPLLIPRFPLVIAAALVLDGVDNGLLRTLTEVDLSAEGPYQSWDKALDIYYLSIAYLSTMRNWTEPLGLRHRPVPLLLPARRERALRAAAVARDAAGVPQHVRVLLHRLRGDPGPV